MIERLNSMCCVYDAGPAAHEDSHAERSLLFESVSATAVSDFDSRAWLSKWEYEPEALTKKPRAVAWA